MEITDIIDLIEPKSARHHKKLKARLRLDDQVYLARANEFVSKYERILDKDGLDMDYAVDKYLNMIEEMVYEQIQFVSSGRYRYSSFDEVNRLVYSNEEYMKPYIHGLLMSQFLWQHHYEIFDFFIERIKKHPSKINRYLEIGGGHGLFINWAYDLCSDGNNSFTCLDISQSSLDLCKNFNPGKKLNYVHQDVFKHEPVEAYDFISMGEVLEHVEDPIALMQKLHALLTDDGTVFITVPTNAAAIDHIYLFRNAGEIIEVCEKAGFEVVEDFSIYAEDVSVKKAEKFKVSMMYACFLKKK
ncbi:MAG: class I SAM-dependent methyltransferase [Roseivirga sp.]|nr:class I SAM-dependent methyltransferase [Roseivirga sp.]